MRVVFILALLMSCNESKIPAAKCGDDLENREVVDGKLVKKAENSEKDFLFGDKSEEGCKVK